MVRVLIADDEEHVISYLRDEIPWGRLDMTLVGAARDGTEAMRRLAGGDVDLLITDVRMPGIDGLELSRQFRKTNEHAQIIVISGYADFEYARSAMNVQAVGYCLKPLSIDEVIRCLLAASSRLASSRISHSSDLLDELESQNLPQAETILRRLGQISTPYRLAVSVGLRNIAQELRADCAVKLGKRKFLYLSGAPMDHDAARLILRGDRIQAGIAILKTPVPIESLRAAISDADVMAHQFFITGTPTLCERLPHDEYASALMRRLEESLVSKEHLRVFIGSLPAYNELTWNIRTAARVYNRVYCNPWMTRAERDADLTLDGYDRLVSEFGSLQAMLRAMRTDMDHLSEAEPCAETSSGTTTFLKLLRYLNENYQQDITLDKLSRQFHLNTDYISRLIKTESGMNYSQYITSLRIEAAKRLLTTSSMTLTEISEAVGYNDYFYFIKRFKKEVGVTPHRYAQGKSSTPLIDAEDS